MSSSFLAQAPTQLHFPPPNGNEFFILEYSFGRGTLKIINGTTQDAAVKLIDNSSKKTRRFVYVQANNEVLLEKINPYRVEMQKQRQLVSAIFKFSR